MAGLLVESGIKEMKKNLHPEKDKPIIENLDFIVNIIKKLDYYVEKIGDKEFSSIQKCAPHS